MKMLDREIDALICQQAWQQQAMQLKIQQITARRLSLQQQKNSELAIRLEKHGGMFSRKPHYDLPAALAGEQITLMLQQPLTLHDMQVSHIQLSQDALTHWLQKHGDIRGKLNGIGFAQVLDMQVDSQDYLVIRDLSLQASRLTLPGAADNRDLPEEIVTALEELESQLRMQRAQFSQHQRCLFISDDWLARIENSLQDVAEQLKKARQ
jgi:MoxR-like ATPase